MKQADVEVTHRMSEVNGVRLHWVERGEGEPIVLLHGFPESWWTWRCQIAPLAAAGFRVIAPDLRGYALSERKGPYDIDTLAADVLGLLDAAGVARANVVGHDWGGGLAWHFADVHADRVRRLAVLNAPHPAPFQRALRGKSLRQMRRSWYMFFFLLPRLPEWLVTRNDGAWTRGFYHHVNGEHLGEEDTRPFFDALKAPGAATAAIDYYRAAVKRGLRSGAAFQTTARIAAPTLLVWGTQDRSLLFDELVPGTEEWVQDLRTEKVEDAGHFVHCERPERVNAALAAHFAS